MCSTWATYVPGGKKEEQVYGPKEMLVGVYEASTEAPGFDARAEVTERGRPAQKRLEEGLDFLLRVQESHWVILSM